MLCLSVIDELSLYKEIRTEQHNLHKNLRNRQRPIEGDREKIQQKVICDQNRDSQNGILSEFTLPTALAVENHRFVQRKIDDGTDHSGENDADQQCQIAFLSDGRQAHSRRHLH